MVKATAMLPQIALCAKKKAWHSGDVPRRKLNRENDVRGTCVFLSLKILFPKSVAHGRPGRTYALYKCYILGQRRLEASN